MFFCKIIIPYLSNFVNTKNSLQQMIIYTIMYLYAYMRGNTMVEIKIVGTFDFSTIAENDKHISKPMLEKKLSDGEILVAQLDGVFLGWLRFSYFWDEIPFMNMLGVVEAYRGHGIGRLLVEEWEGLMRDKGYDKVMTSTLENEDAQHFYRKLGYRDLGKFTSFENEFELILGKEL